MGSKVKDTVGALRLIQRYKSRLKAQNEEGHLKELEYIKHILDSPAFQSQLKEQPSYFREDRERVVERRSGSEEMGVNGVSSPVSKQTGGKPWRYSHSHSPPDGRYSSGSESGSVGGHNTWRRVKRRNEKQASAIPGEDLIVEDTEEAVEQQPHHLHASPQRRSLEPERRKEGPTFRSGTALADGDMKKSHFSRNAKSEPNILDSVDRACQSPYPATLTSQPGRWSPTTRGDPTRYESVNTDSEKEIVTVSLHKPKSGGLGFSVVGLKSDNRGELGTFIQDIQPGSMTDRDGRLRCDDEILSINGKSLSGMTQERAISLLRSTKGKVDLVVARVRDKTSSKVLVPSKSKAQRHYNIETIELHGRGKSYGFGIIDSKLGGVEVYDIKEGSVAERNGRLRPGDRLLQINEQNAEHMTCYQAALQLQASKSSVRLVIARVASDTQEEKLPYFSVSYHHTEVYDVELKKDASGLGITIAGAEQHGLQGIVVTSITPRGPADCSGKMKTGDQILTVDGRSLLGMENKAAAAIIRNSGERVKLTLGRTQPPPELHKPREATDGRPNHSPARRSSDTIRAYWKTHLNNEFLEVKVVTVEKSPTDGGLGIRLDGIQEHDKQGDPVGSIHHVVQSVKPDGPIGRQQALDVQDELLEVNGVSLVNMSHDEAVQVIKNAPQRVQIVAVPYISATDSPSPNTLREMISKGPPVDHSQDDTTSVEGHPTSESEDDKQKATTSSSWREQLDKLQTNDEWKPTLERIRAERESLRQKYELEKEKLRLKIEQNKKEYEQELAEQEMMLKEHEKSVQIWKKQMEMEEEEERIRREKRREEMAAKEKANELPPWPKFLEEMRRGATVKMPPYPSMSSPEVFTGTDVDDKASVSSHEGDSPHKITGEWSDEIETICLHKGPEGLGFSLMHYKLLGHISTSTVVLVCDLVNGSIAQQDGRLKKADQLLFIGEVNVIGQPVSVVVDILKATRSGPVVLKVRHAKHCSLLEEEEEDPFVQSLSSIDARMFESPSKDFSAHVATERTAMTGSPSAGNFQPSPQSAFHPVIQPVPQPAIIVPDSTHQHTWSLSEPCLMSAISSTSSDLNANTRPKTGTSPMIENGVQGREDDSTTHRLRQAKKAVSRSVADILLDGMDEAEPRTCHIHVGSREVGLGLACDEVRGVIVVKHILKGGAVERDGRIREGDRIVAINSRKLEGITLKKARLLLKKAAGRHPKEISLQYIPCPQGYIPRVTASLSENAPVSERDTSLFGGVPLQPSTRVGHAHHDDRALLTSRGQGEVVTDGHASKQRPKLARADRISSTSTVIEHGTSTTDEDTSGSRENIAPNDDRSGVGSAFQLLDLIHDPASKNAMLMASAEEGPTQRAARALTHEKKKFPIPDAPVSQEGSRDESGSTPDGLSPEFEAGDREINLVPFTSKFSPHQYSRSTDAVKLKPERNRRKGGYSRNSCDAIHMIESSSSESDGELHLQHRRSGHRRRNGPSSANTSGAAGSSGGRHLLQQYPHLHSHDHKRQSSQPQESTSPPHASPTDGEGRGAHLKEGSGGKLVQVRQVQLHRDSSGSLGIGIVGGEQSPDSKGKRRGIFVSSISTAIAGHVKGLLRPGDQILEVNGRDLTSCSHHEAVQTIKMAASPVVLVVRCRLESVKQGRKSSQAQPQHQQHNSWAFDEDEDKSLRSEFPSADGHLYKVSLERGQQGLGMSIFSNKSGRGVMVTSVVTNGVADETGKIKEGDEIVKVNNIVTLGMTDVEVSRILREAPSTINLVMLRPSAHIPKPVTTTSHDTAGGGKGTKPFKVVHLPKDIQCGFGVTLDEVRLPTGKTVIAIMSITAGGPAEREGQLSVGDHILSIDGESVVGPGVALQQVHRLLAEAQVKGSTTLVAADAASFPSSRQEGSRGGAPGDKWEVHTSPTVAILDKYDTRVMRPKRRKPSPKKRRANSSRESEPGVTSGLHQARQASTDYQQQASEWTLQPGEPIVPGEMCVLEIHKQHNSLGLRIVGGVETQLKDIYIQDILKGTAAYVDGRLCPGDQIISVGSVSLLGVRHEQAKQVLRDAQSPVRLTVLRDLARSPRISFSDDPSTVNVEIVELTKASRAGLGLSINERENEAGVFVEQVFPHSPAFKDGRIRAGDKILAINGHDVSTARQDVVFLTLQGCKDVVKLTISHPVCITPREKDEPLKRQPLQIPPVSAAKQQPQATQAPISTFQPTQGRRGEPYYSDTSRPRPHLPQYPASYMPPVYPQGVGPHENIHGFAPVGVPPPYHTPTAPSYYPVSTSVRPTSASRLVQQTSFPPPSYASRHHSASNIQPIGPAPPPVQAPQPYPPPAHHGYHGDARSPGSAIQPPSHPRQGYPHATGFHRYLPGGVADGKDLPYSAARPPGNARHVKVVRLRKGRSGLGFVIAGGVGSPLGNLPIFVKEVLVDGAAWKEGQLCRGDEILFVNGIDFRGFTQEHAISALSSIHGDIEMHVLSS